MRSYLKKVLDVLVPNKGNEALEYVLQQHTSRKVGKFGTVGNELLDNMARLYGQTQNREIKYLMFLLMCGVLKRNECNTRIRNALIQLGDVSPWKGINKWKFKRGSTFTLIICPYILRCRYLSSTSLYVGAQFMEYVYPFGELPQKTYGSRLKKDQALYILDWLKRKCRLGWKPGVIKSHVVGDETHNLPVLNRSDKPWNLWEQFAEQHPHKEAEDVEKVWIPGRGTFLELVK
jgi:hypothetical protein